MKLNIQKVTLAELLHDEEAAEQVEQGLVDWYDALERNFPDEHIQADVNAGSLIEELEYNGMTVEKIADLHQAVGYDRYGGYIDLFYVEELGIHVMVVFLPRAW